MRLSKLLFPALAFAALAFRPAHADGTHLEQGKVYSVFIIQNFPGTSKVVDGVKIYTEGTPILAVKLKGENGKTGLFANMPYSGDKAKAIFELAKSAGDRDVTIYYSDDHMTKRTECEAFSEDGCVELGSSYQGKTIEYLNIQY